MTENRGPEVSAMAGLFLALSWIFVSMRCYCRIIVVKSFGLDDWLCLIAQILYTFFCAFAITGVQYGTGQHSQDIQPQTNIPIGLKWWWACEPVYVLSNMALKFSIGLFLLRIAVSKTQKMIIWSVMIVTGVVSMYFFFLFVFQCWPVAYFWEQYAMMKGSCINPDIITASTYAYSAVTCWADWTFCILPAFMVWNLQMNPRTKISVCLILAGGAVASAATIIRIPYVNGLTNIADFLYATTDVAVWSLVETGLGLCAAAAATLRPIFRIFLSRSRLLGGSTKQDTGAWPSSRAGYLRSEGRPANKNGDVEIGLRSDVGKHGVTTEIASHKHYQKKSTDDVKGDMGMTRTQINPSNWNNSQTKLTQETDEFGAPKEWHGIRKTMVVTTHRT